MSVYVDDMIPCIPNRNWRHKEACHLFADTETELLGLASGIGLKPEWIQRGSLVHFDLTRSKRRVAVAAGAVELNRDAAVAFWRAHRR